MSKTYKKILLIDDDKINNYLSEEIISDMDIAEEVVVLTNGQQALDYIKSLVENGEIAAKMLVLLDLNMPVMDGFEFMDEFKTLQLNDDAIEIIVLTSSDNQRDKEKIKLYNISRFISKPITEEKLATLL